MRTVARRPTRWATQGPLGAPGVMHLVFLHLLAHGAGPFRHRTLGGLVRLLVGVR